MKKCLVGHAGARDFYQLSMALQEHSLLEKLVTDFYIPDAIIKFLKRRPETNIPASKISISSSALFEFVKEKIPFLKSSNFIKKDNAISDLCLKEALATNCNLLLYSYYAYNAFTYLKDNGYQNKRILFQLHPHPLTIRKILEEEIERLPFTESSICKESEFSIDKASLERLSQEVHLAENCIVASSFTKNSLIENGANPDKIKVIPYGVNTSGFPAKINYSLKQSLNIIFVGSMVQRKGLADLLAALKLVNRKDVTLTLIGRTIIDKNLLNHFSDIDFTIKINISASSLIKELHNADVFILPALAEGFAHVLLEAMSAGLPIITTTNTAGPDIITDGKEGFIIPAKSPEVIAEKIALLLKDKNLCRSMGVAAALKAKDFSWQKFRSDVAAYYINTCNNSASKI